MYNKVCTYKEFCISFSKLKYKKKSFYQFFETDVFFVKILISNEYIKKLWLCSSNIFC